ncbi:MAG: hypothetical protein U9O94_06245 [Nanoarchaeota archaeon]|nr:hypothetical protein [Nanoarchaeota archaeon]
MKYEILRASTGGLTNSPKPCKKAYLENKQWFIDINTLTELNELVTEVGDIVYDRESIIIYDDFLE